MKKEQVRDSKDVLDVERNKLAKLIKGIVLDHKIIKISPKEIDDCENLNTLEAQNMAEIVNLLNIGKNKKEKIKVVVDCPSNNLFAWKNTFISFLEFKENLNIFCEHKADVNHVSASAASILAKFTREEEVSKIKKEFGEIGSGYPSDPYTKKFLEEKGLELKDSGIFRKSWATWKNRFHEVKKGQKNLGDF